MQIHILVDIDIHLCVFLNRETGLKIHILVDNTAIVALQ